MKTPIFPLCATLALAACATTTRPPAPAFAAAAPTTAASSTAPVAVAAASPPPRLLKLAKQAGYHTRKLKEGTTVFCKEEPHLGSRFSTESCIDEVQLQDFLIRAEDQRDKLKNRRGTGTDFN